MREDAFGLGASHHKALDEPAGLASCLNLGAASLGNSSVVLHHRLDSLQHSVNNAGGHDDGFARAK